MKFLKPLGEYLTESHRDKLEQAARDAIKMVEDAGFHVDVVIAIDLEGEKFQNILNPRAANALFVPSENTIYLNGTSDVFLNYSGTASNRTVRRGHWGPLSVSEHPLATIIHEIGHSIHYRENPTLFGQMMRWGRDREPAREDQNLVKQKYMVSEYALKSWLEFVAEVFCGLVLKKKFNTVIMHYYYTHKGPEPK